MKLIVGLGNPTSQYARTRHNAGFMVIDRLANRCGLSGPKTKFSASLLDGVIAQHRCLLMEPTTYMNRSGLAVSQAVQFYKLDSTTDLLIITDDVALPCGRLRLRTGGSAGGHNGLLDIERALNTQQYNRLRLGIDLPGRIPQSDYVLGKFSPQQIDLIADALDIACDAVECWIAHGPEQTMNRYNAAS